MTGTGIFKLYLAAFSKSELNISRELVQELEKIIEDTPELMTISTFDHVAKYVEHNILNDALFRFIASKEYIELFSSRNQPQPLTRKRSESDSSVFDQMPREISKSRTTRKGSIGNFFDGKKRESDTTRRDSDTSPTPRKSEDKMQRPGSFKSSGDSSSKRHSNPIENFLSLFRKK
jgi:hypothetical protein